MEQRAAHPFDGFRAVLVLLVVFGHVELVGFLAGGQSRVIAFFALSGFLITAVLLKRHGRTGSVGLRDFYAMRVSRFAPTLLAVTVLALIASLAHSFQWWSAESVWIGAMVEALPTFWSQTTNVPLQQGLELPYELVPSWSIAIEWQFYLIWPLIAALMLRHLDKKFLGITAAVVAVAGFLLSIALTLDPGTSEQRVTYGADTRGGAILLGCATAVLVCRPDVRDWIAQRVRPISVVSLAVVCLLFFQTFFDPAPHMATWGQVALACAVCALAAVMWVKPSAFPLLVITPLAWIGQRSLGVFLVHVPIMQLLGGRGNGMRAMTVIVLTLLVVWVAHRYLDAPLLAWVRRTLKERDARTVDARPVPA